jgi:hypothetical protein
MTKQQAMTFLEKFTEQRLTRTMGIFDPNGKDNIKTEWFPGAFDSVRTYMEKEWAQLWEGYLANIYLDQDPDDEWNKFYTKYVDTLLDLRNLVTHLLEHAGEWNAIDGTGPLDLPHAKLHPAYLYAVSAGMIEGEK